MFLPHFSSVGCLLFFFLLHLEFFLVGESFRNYRRKQASLTIPGGHHIDRQIHTCLHMCRHVCLHILVSMCSPVSAVIYTIQRTSIYLTSLCFFPLSSSLLLWISGREEVSCFPSLCCALASCLVCLVCDSW